MAEKAVSGHSIRGTEGDIPATEKAANQSRKEYIRANSFAEAGKVSSTFANRLDQHMNAYTGTLSDFGCPGNTVDSWRVHFTGREPSLRAANAKISRK